MIPLPLYLTRVTCVVGALLSVLTSGLRSCQAQTVTSGPLEAAAHAPAPSWVKPGLRLTYYTAVASARGQGRDWKPDKNGGFVDAQGNHWSGDDKLSIGGHGFIQHDVVALDSRQVALQQSDYMLNLQEPLTLLGTQGLLAPAGTGGELWVDPALLKQLSDGMHAGFQVYRAPYRIGNTNRESVWMHQASNSGTVLYIYDRATGVLLHYASAGKPVKGQVLGPDETENTSNVMMFQSTLADQRMLKLPWMADDVSGWLAHVGTLHYQGMAMTGSPGFSNSAVRQSVAVTVALQSHGDRWALFTSTLSGGNLAHQSQIIMGSAQIGALWIAPQTLSHLPAGQELDHDPITGVITRVGRSSHPAETIISEIGATFQFDFHYDSAHGDLIGLEQSEHHPYVIKKVELSLHR